ncbi:hypothetical protein [Vibrio phage vB_VhaM_VH-8]|nr:hypothetical protein [Vibrio phage vB_VhaM_VH-8]
MIKIYPQLWFITDDMRENNLSYMCQYELTESGEVAANVKKMQDTGRSWAKKSDTDDTGVIIDNIPTKNIYVGCSVSRWSTSNKLFRVTDPRGFTIEIPTDNLATLLHHTTVIKGVIQEECVWGKEGNNHILLPVNSEPYKLSIEQQNILDNELVSVKDIKAGDWVKFFGGDIEYYFFGRVKLTWNVRGRRSRHYYNWSSREQKDDEYTDWYDIEDNKYVNLFLRNINYNNETAYCAETLTNPKIVEVLRNDVIDIDLKDVGRLHTPERVINRLSDLIDVNYYRSTDSEIVGFKHKP